MPDEPAKQHGFWSALPFFGISKPKPGEEARTLKLLILIGGSIALLTAVVIILLLVNSG
ncbi:MAG TPA: hypothetical protein VF493_14800 [Terriglobales bacterium]